MRAIFLLLLALLSTAATPPSPPTYSTLKLQVEDGRVFCSAFVINEKKHLIMTADHCMGSEVIWVEGREAREIFHVPELDVAIMEAPATHQRSLEPRLDIPTPGEPLRALGYAGGVQAVKTLNMRLLLPVIKIFPMEGLWVLYAPANQPGMSGGPIVDEGGRVVTISQQMNNKPDVSISHPMFEIYQVTKEYWEIQLDLPFSNPDAPKGEIVGGSTPSQR